jgi:hypothetical protein
MAEYTQVTRQEFPSTDPARQGKTDVAYVYMDERTRTHTIIFPLEEDSADRVMELLKARVVSAEAGGAKRIEL